MTLNLTELKDEALYVPPNRAAGNGTGLAWNAPKVEQVAGGGGRYA
jgi:hypothetical protein